MDELKAKLERRREQQELDVSLEIRRRRQEEKAAPPKRLKFYEPAHSRAQSSSHYSSDSD